MCVIFFCWIPVVSYMAQESQMIQSEQRNLLKHIVLIFFHYSEPPMVLFSVLTDTHTFEYTTSAVSLCFVRWYQIRTFFISLPTSECVKSPLVALYVYQHLCSACGSHEDISATPGSETDWGPQLYCSEIHFWVCSKAMPPTWLTTELGWCTKSGQFLGHLNQLWQLTLPQGLPMACWTFLAEQSRKLPSIPSSLMFKLHHVLRALLASPKITFWDLLLRRPRLTQYFSFFLFFWNFNYSSTLFQSVSTVCKQWDAH